MATNDVGRGYVDDGATHVFDSHFASYNDVDCSSNHDEDGVEKDHGTFSDTDDDDDEDSASLYIGMPERINSDDHDSNLESDDDDDDGYSRSDNSMSCDNPIPCFDKPLFSPKQPHLSAAYQL